MTLMTLVEPYCIGREKPSHEFREIVLRAFGQEMDMGFHKAVGVDTKVKKVAVLAQIKEKTPSVPIGKKNRILQIPSTHDMKEAGG